MALAWGTWFQATALLSCFEGKLKAHGGSYRKPASFSSRSAHFASSRFNGGSAGML